MTRVLVIEDEPLVGSTISQVLQKAGYEVDLAGNGREGLEIQERTPADLVITDIIMPEKDGVETTIELRSRFPETRVLAISGGGRIRNMDFLEHARKMGAHGVLSKPFNRQQLLDAVRKALDEPAS